ncbi:MAG TPA: hypothetical protein VN873_01095 [Candidatus Angelobacter sp.]|nr:hypothetical protein [Candidatus Angelobacter sp.]
MNASETQVVHAPSEVAWKRMESGLIGETVGSVAVIALAIVGLAGVWPTVIAAVATIVLAAAIIIEGGLFAGTEMPFRLGEWTSTKPVAGLAALILGILALLGTAPATLLCVAAIVFGAALLFGRLTEGEIGGGQALVGIAAVVLGILGVVGLTQMTLVLVALLSLGVMELLVSLENGSKIVAEHKRHPVS